VTFTVTIIGEHVETYGHFYDAIVEFSERYKADKKTPPGYKIAVSSIIYTAGGTNLYVDAWFLSEILDELDWFDETGNLTITKKEPDPVWLEYKFRHYAPQCDETAALKSSKKTLNNLILMMRRRPPGTLGRLFFCGNIQF